MPSRLSLAATLVAMLALPALAQQGQQRRTEGQGPQASEQAQPARAVRQLPADQTTTHSVELPGRTLKFQATAGSIPLLNGDGRLLAEMAYVAYRLEGADPAKRPVTFAFNGGPGSASGWVNIGGFGPWRIEISGDAVAPSAPPVLKPNAETWLDFTDLVFIDPIGTGYSRMARQEGAGVVPTGGPSSSSPPAGGGDANRRYYSVTGDAESVAEVIFKWLRNSGRMVSPKMIAGESYGGIRAPRVTALLQSSYGVGMNAVVLVSPVMDFGSFRGPRHHVEQFVNILPTIAATARELQGKPPLSRTDLAEVETYARTEYLGDLMKGPRDAAAFERLVKRVSAYSGLAEPIVRKYGARLDEFIFMRETYNPQGRRASGYDATVTGYDADPTTYFPAFEDPFSSALVAPVTGAMLDLYGRLGWKTDLGYHLMSSDVNRAWTWGNSTSSPESFTHLRAALALDPHLRVLVTHGFYDLRTPYFGSALLLEQLPPMSEGRVTLSVYPGGHMHYSRDASRAALQRDVQRFLAAAVAADPARR